MTIVLERLCNPSETHVFQDGYFLPRHPVFERPLVRPSALRLVGRFVARWRYNRHRRRWLLLVPLLVALGQRFGGCLRQNIGRRGGWLVGWSVAFLGPALDCFRTLRRTPP